MAAMRKVIPAATLSLALLLSAAAGLQFVRLVSAQNPQTFEVITIKADGSVDPATAPITHSGNIYTLTRNIIGSITIAKSDTIFDGAGYTVQYCGKDSLPSQLIPDNHVGWGEITLDQVNNVIIKNVRVVGTGKSPPNPGVGIWLFDTNSSIIANNTVSLILSGIHASGRCSGNVIAGNTAMNNQYGISFSSYSRYSNNTIIGNCVNGSYIGIDIRMNHDGDASGNTVVGNQIANNQIGMHFLWLGDYYSSKPNPFEMNTRVYYNNFINNSQNVVNGHIIYDPDCANIWDNGKLGNYWSDYNGTDTNNDGIGDTPYVIDGNNQDNYPLMTPFDIGSVHIELPDLTTPPSLRVINPENTTYASANITLEFTVNKQTSWIGYSLDGEANVTITGNTTLPDLSYGSHNITVYATDMVGHNGASETIYFNITEPFPTTLVIAPIASVAAVGLGLLVYFGKIRKNKSGT